MPSGEVAGQLREPDDLSRCRVHERLDGDPLAPDGVVEVVERYFPDEPLNDRSRLLVEDLLAEQN